MKFSIKDFFSKRDQIRSFLRDQICSFPWIWSHLMKKSVIENLIFYVVNNMNFIKCGEENGSTKILGCVVRAEV